RVGLQFLVVEVQRATYDEKAAACLRMFDGIPQSLQSGVRVGEDQPVIEAQMGAQSFEIVQKKREFITGGFCRSVGTAGATRVQVNEGKLLLQGNQTLHVHVRTCAPTRGRHKQGGASSRNLVPE